MSPHEVTEAGGLAVVHELGLVTAYLSHRAASGDLARTSEVVIRSTLTRFVRSLDVPLSEATKQQVIDWLMPHVHQPNTCKSMITKLRPFVRWLVETDRIAKDFTLGVKHPRIVVGPPRSCSSTEVIAVLEQCPDTRARVIVLLMVMMGLRAKEVAAIMLEDINLDGGMLAVRGKGGRGRVTRSVPIQADARRAIVSLLAQSPAFYGPLVRSYRDGRPLSPHWISELVARWFRDAGVDETGHALRHTCAQDLLDEGADPQSVQDLLGHASVATTLDLYRRRRPVGLRALMDERRFG